MSLPTSLRVPIVGAAVLGGLAATLVGLAAPSSADVIPGGSLLGPTISYQVSPSATALASTIYATTYYYGAHRSVRSFE
jgi:hypothetical protein